MEPLTSLRCPHCKTEQKTSQYTLLARCQAEFGDEAGYAYSCPNCRWVIALTVPIYFVGLDKKQPVHIG